MKNIFFSLNKEDEDIIHKRNEQISKRQYKGDDAIEKDYYYHVIDRIKKLSSYKITGWNYWYQHYGNKNWSLLEREPYFGSILEKGGSRVYIGKQSFFDIDTSKSYVYDWRSTFGDLYYRRKKHSFIEKRYVELEDIREYIDKYIYVDLLTDDYSDFLEDSLKSKTAGFLCDIVETIDDVQNEIIRSIDNKYEVIDGGPGTGKTTIGLHILSYKTYYFTKTYKKYPRIIIVIANDSFKSYINEALVNLDLYGKNFHNTEIYSFNEVLSKNNLNCDYAFIDEAQDFSESDFKKLLSIIDAKNTIICADNNQNISNVDGFNLVEYFQIKGYEFKRRHINKNYRNPIKVVNFADAISGALQVPINKKDSNINFAIWNDRFNPEDIIINELSTVHKNELNAAIYLDSMSKKYILDILLKKNIKYYKGIEHINHSDSILVLSAIEAKGFEFDNVVVIGRDIDFLNLIKNNELYVSITRTMNDLLVVSNNFFYESMFDDELYSCSDVLINSYNLFMSGFEEKSIQLLLNYSFNDVINKMLNINDDSAVKFLEFVIDFTTDNRINYNISVCNNKNIIYDLFDASHEDIISLLFERKIIIFKDLLERIDNIKIKNYIINNIDILIGECSQEEIIYAFKLIDLKILISAIDKVKKKVIYSTDIKYIILNCNYKYDVDFLSNCVTSALLKKNDLYHYILESGNKVLLKWLECNLEDYISCLDSDEMIILYKFFDHKKIIDAIIKTKIKVSPCEQITHLILEGDYRNDKEFLNDCFGYNLIPLNLLFEHIIKSQNDELIQWFETHLIDQFITKIDNNQMIMLFENINHKIIIESIKRTNTKVQTSSPIKKAIFDGQYSCDVSLLNDCLNLKIIDKDSLFIHIINDCVFLIDNYYELYLDEIIDNVLCNYTPLIEYLKGKTDIINSIKSYLLSGFHLIKLLKFNKAIKKFFK